MLGLVLGLYLGLLLGVHEGEHEHVGVWVWFRYNLGLA